jgi:hypothetical protein
MSNGAVTSIRNTPVKKQTVGNCWLYAFMGWAEALHKGATGLTVQLSVSYLTYWHWFDQLVAFGECAPTSINEGAGWGVAKALVSRYGVMRTVDFIPEEALREDSTRQEPAFEAVQAAL